MGGTAVEFAIVAFPLVLFIVFMLELSYDFFAQVALDLGVQTAARQIQIGNAQTSNTAALFQANYLCPVLSGLLPCSSVIVNITPVTSDYFSAVSATLPTDKAGKFDSSGFTYCPGSPRQLMLIQAVYTSPSFIAAVIPGMATGTTSGLAHLTLSSTAFINENFPAIGVPPAGC